MLILEKNMAKDRDPFSRAMRTICAEHLGLSGRESLIIVADPPLLSLADCMARAAEDIGQACELVEIGEVEKPGKSPPGFTAALLARGAAALMVTSKSLSHTAERRTACRKYGVRVASMPGLTEDMILRLFRPGSAALVSKRTLEMAAKLEGAGIVRVCSRKGTELELSLDGRKILKDNGLYHEPGSFGNLPAGEVCASPVAGSVRGTLAVDVAFAGLGRVEGLVLEIGRGILTKARGPESERIFELLAGNAERVAGEFGIGTNPLAKPGPVTLEAEKAVGTVHLGFGDNLSFRGKNRASGHWDAVASYEQIEVDGKTL